MAKAIVFTVAIVIGVLLQLVAAQETAEGITVEAVQADFSFVLEETSPETYLVKATPNLDVIDLQNVSFTLGQDSEGHKLLGALSEEPEASTTVVLPNDSDAVAIESVDEESRTVVLRVQRFPKASATRPFVLRITGSTDEAYELEMAYAENVNSSSVTMKVGDGDSSRVIFLFGTFVNGTEFNLQVQLPGDAGEEIKVLEAVAGAAKLSLQRVLTVEDAEAKPEAKPEAATTDGEFDAADRTPRLVPHPDGGLQCVLPIPDDYEVDQVNIVLTDGKVQILTRPQLLGSFDLPEALADLEGVVHGEELAHRLMAFRLNSREAAEGEDAVEESASEAAVEAAE